MIYIIGSYVASFFALIIIMYSYFANNKKYYLLFQCLGIVCLITSYLFMSKYFATLSMIVALIRTITFGVYEYKNKNAPLFFSYLFVILTILTYVLVNVIILKIISWLDILHVIALCFYAFTFRIRNLTTMRKVILMPNVLEVLYNLIMFAPLFTTLSYFFELLSNVVAIFKFDIKKSTKKVL